MKLAGCHVFDKEVEFDAVDLGKHADALENQVLKQQDDGL